MGTVFRESAAMLVSKVRSVLPLARGFSSTVGMRQKAMEEDEESGEAARPATAQMRTMLDIGSRSIFCSDQDMYREQARRSGGRWEPRGCWACQPQLKLEVSELHSWRRQ